MSRLESIIARGNRGHVGWDGTSTIQCADGFTLSVIAGGGTYCTPRPTLCSHSIPGREGEPPEPPDYVLSVVACDYDGGYQAVEVGFPSQRPEPWDEWSECFEDFGDTDPTGGVYGYVPVAMVRTLVASHGGEVDGDDQ